MSKQTDLINIPDAITVDGTGILNLDSTFSSGTTGGIIRLKDAGTQFGDFNEDSGSFIISSAQVDKDIIFKGNDGGAIITAMTIDMSSGGNVGIGTSSPSRVLHTSGDVVRFDNAGPSAILLIDTTNNEGFRLVTNRTSGAFSIEDMGTATSGAGTERMVIDSSGNLLVGKAAAGISAAGHSYRADGTWEVRRNISSAGSSSVGYLSRGTTDGSILAFYKDTTTVGSIFSGHGGTQVGIGTNTTGITFNPNTRSMMPANPSSTSPQLDATLDIGFPSVRWKDAYLSGGVYLGGTGSANKLDDVETGTWTPQYDANTITWNYQSQFGAYVKVGKLVHIQFYLNASIASGTSGFTTKIINLPFTSANLSSLHQSGMSVWFSGSIDPQPLVDNAQTKISLWKKGAVALATAADVSSHYLVGSGTYYAS
jgi:hypothetical protein